MLSKTRAVVATGPGKLETRTYPLPEIGDDLSPEEGVLICAVVGNGIR